MLVWNLVSFPHLPPFSCLLSPSLPPFPLCPFLVPGSPPLIQLLTARQCGNHCVLSHWEQAEPGDKRFLMHSESKMMLLMIALLQHTGIVFLKKEMVVWFCADQGSANTAYHLALSHLQP